MSDRGIPRSYRMMEGFGVHTFRLVNAAGETCLVKWHWKPQAGVHSLLWEEAQLLSGIDPDFHRRDLADAIEAGNLPEWELGIQVFPDTDEQTFEGIDLLDPTKIVPEELAPVQPVGRMTLTANPSNYFAETEQVAFHTGHLVPGIDVTDDPLLAGRMFSYLDTQITRLGGPNFPQLPINRPQVPVNDMLRDGMHQTAVHRGVAPYRPNSLDGGCPFVAGADLGGYVEVPQALPASRKVREAPASFADHYSQVRQFWLSMTPVEQEHIVAAYSFELAKCYDATIRQRQLIALSHVDDGLCQQVAGALGLDAPPSTVEGEPDPSPALSQMGGEWPVTGRVVGVVVTPGQGDSVTTDLVAALGEEGIRVLVLAPVGGSVETGQGAVLTVNRTFATMRSVELDSVAVTGAAAADPRVAVLLQEAYRHAKPIVAVPDASALLTTAGVDAGAAGVVVDADPIALADALVVGLSRHRVWHRAENSAADPV
jgi:catalase